MKSYTAYEWFNTDTRRQYLNVTDKVSEAVRKSGIKEGFVLVSTKKK